MIREIRAKTLLSRVSGIDTYFGLDYGINLYRGCQHHCIYCDSRSRCYGIDDFDGEVLVKANAIDLLSAELPRKRRKGIIGTGSMNDPYMPLEKELRLTQQTLEVIASNGFGVHVITKSDLVVRDIPLLRRIGRLHTAAVSLSISTADDRLARKIEPGAPVPSDRFDALRRLKAAGIETRIALMPVLPFLEDTKENVDEIIRRAHACGVSAVVPWFGMSLRDRQRAHYYRCLDALFPGIKAKYIHTYGEAYMCPVPEAGRFYEHLVGRCQTLGIATAVAPALAPTAHEPGLFDS